MERPPNRNNIQAFPNRATRQVLLRTIEHHPAREDTSALRLVDLETYLGILESHPDTTTVDYSRTLRAIDLALAERRVSFNDLRETYPNTYRVLSVLVNARHPALKESHHHAMAIVQRHFP